MQKIVTNSQPSAKAYCNVAAQALGLDPAGNAGHFDDAVLVETPLPWKRHIYEQAGVLPQECIDLLALWLERYKAGAPYNHRPLLIAPDPDYSHQGYRRVIYCARQSGFMAQFTRTEYLVPEADAGPLIWALFEAKEELSRFDPYRLPETASKGRPTRDILVCTHGSVDVACAKFGYPLYQYLRHKYAGDDLRVWRVSHFGGHVFAPTIMDMPSGHYWAYVGETQATQIIERSGDAADLRAHYRGWAGVDRGFAQAAECEIWQREGWTWFDASKSCTVLDRDDGDDPTWIKVRFDFTTIGGRTGSYLVRVEVVNSIEMSPSTNGTTTHSYLQYAVKDLEQLSSMRKAT